MTDEAALTAVSRWKHVLIMALALIARLMWRRWVQAAPVQIQRDVESEYVHGFDEGVCSRKASGGPQGPC